MSNSKKPHKPFTHSNFNDVTLGDLIKDSSNHFDFGDINNDPSNVDPTVKYNYVDSSDNDAMILTNLFKN